MAARTGALYLREGVKLMWIRFPWLFLVKVVVAGLAAAAAAWWLPRGGWFLIANLVVSCLVYGASLLALDEWRPTKHQLARLRSSLGFGDELRH